MSIPAARALRDLPGPRGWPLVGNLLQIRPASIHRDVERWANEFGSLYRLRFGSKDVLVVADHELATAVLRDRPEGFRRNPLGARIGREMGLPEGMINAEGEEWRKQRRMVMASFAPGNIRSYFPALVRVALRLRGRWQRAARERRAIPLQADLMRFTVDVIAGLAFGSDVNTLESGEDTIQAHLDKVLPVLYRRKLSIVPYWRWLKLPADRAVDRSVAAINAAIRGYVAEGRRRLRDDPGRRAAPQNLLEAMIVAADEADSGLDDAHVIGNVMNMLLAGEETTANTLAWMIDLLVRNPAARRRAEEEVRSIAPDPAAFSFDQMERLHYLEGCVHETMRLKPVIPILTLQAIDDTVVGDVAIPRDTTIFVVLRHDSLNGRYFERPEAFEPDRWLAAAAQPLPPAARRVSLPFGAGPRVCPGRYLAILEMKVAMAMLLASFDIEAVDTPDGGPARELMAFSLQPIGQNLRLRDRR
ncbi:MAG: cytochrome P450 [Planctomycetia bacterium]